MSRVDARARDDARTARECIRDRATTKARLAMRAILRAHSSRVSRCAIAVAKTVRDNDAREDVSRKKRSHAHARAAVRFALARAHSRAPHRVHHHRAIANHARARPTRAHPARARARNQSHVMRSRANARERARTRARDARAGARARGFPNPHPRPITIRSARTHSNVGSVPRHPVADATLSRHTPTPPYRALDRRTDAPRATTHDHARAPIPRTLAHASSSRRRRPTSSSSSSSSDNSRQKVPRASTARDADADARDMSIAAHARFKDGTIKHACFAALYAAGAAGLTVRTTTT